MQLLDIAEENGGGGGFEPYSTRCKIHNDSKYIADNSPFPSRAVSSHLIPFKTAGSSHGYRTAEDGWVIRRVMKGVILYHAENSWYRNSGALLFALLLTSIGCFHGLFHFVDFRLR